MTCRRWLPAVLVAGVVLVAGLGMAHDPPPPVADRELIRLQGHRRADGDAASGRMTLTALGGEHPFAASAREAYSLTPQQAASPAVRYTLQGPRPLLARFAAARPEQTVTILAEHRPGSDTLFLLTLDLCPPQ